MPLIYPQRIRYTSATVHRTLKGYATNSASMFIAPTNVGICSQLVQGITSAAEFIAPERVRYTSATVHRTLRGYATNVGTCSQLVQGIPRISFVSPFPPHDP
ncbi:hypothetical protein JXM67_11865 [candidate division WOR-3 bacterium]|nr:hypothetical protein [candidate division WOR-3 bacterium]